MPINTLEYSKIFMTQLDRLAVQQMVTGWMDANAGQVRYSGGDEVKIPKISTVGLADYDRDDGYVQGGVTLAYETRKMTQDRGRKFQLDAMDVDETNFVATAAAVMGDFQTQHVIPEIDAYRLSKLAAQAIAKNNTETGYASSPLAAVKNGIKEVRDNAKNAAAQVVIHAKSDFVNALELELVGRIQYMTARVNGIDTRVPSVDGCPIIPTDSSRMVSAIQIYDGTTEGQEAGGFIKAEGAKDVNFLAIERATPIAVTKQDIMRIFDPATNQKANAWSLDYRRYHDLWVLDNKQGNVFANLSA